MQIDTLSRRLIDRFQHGMPLCAEPYRAMADALECSEDDVLACLERLESSGGLSRIGPVFEHSRAGASTLVALAVPEVQLERVAELINCYAEVNHNYLREHHYNLWFVLTGPDRAHIDALLVAIEAQTGLIPLDLPMQTAYRIDLGFPIGEAP
ncbi:Lrp/AsnC family transcriptional regulator [Stutzerimonas xanthomarina]|uniref:siroheme decarboxylase n=2 Tax=Stutzerimonas xanthomarina TaxID=271420 RepID=A0A1M5QLB4_9GAMM|nr:Lrp/AsnC family transcriptional regulator [Stutzerimonas xanthomarina]MCP9338518.1 Lrp/AsnC family transcriptional regulator [Stutzerimonas xanthomarina]SEH67360.1 DNA-binding transcriptional regulator, Lrp family [Stutzerimonas xanthomarina]SHH14756.1 transcriptional regulator, AsnC family [Stutzerimonas xanthomarina DSM 18231]